MEYEEKLGKEKYSNFLANVLDSLYIISKTDTRIVIVVPFRCGVKSGRWSRLKVCMECMEDIGWNVRDLIVWNQQDIQGTAWGSWKSSSAPNIQYQTEYAVVGFKEQWEKERDGKSTVSASNFKKWTISNIWNITTDSGNPHPASYPSALVERFIKLFTYEDDLVLDPMCGSGTTCTVAKRLNRNYIGIEKEKKYYKIAKQKLNQEYLDKFGI
jgi:site-specific DNA-methyltransferase (adenine-specific)